MESVIYFNRAFRPEREATISVRSRALNYGLGCFAGIRGYKTDDGRQVHVFRLDRHVRRLEQSARILRLRLSGAAGGDRRVIVELLRRNEMRGDVYIRPIVFANSNELSPLLDPGHQRDGDLLHAASDGYLSPTRSTCASRAGGACARTPFPRARRPPAGT